MFFYEDDSLEYSHISYAVQLQLVLLHGGAASVSLTRHFPTRNCSAEEWPWELLVADTRLHRAERVSRFSEVVLVNQPYTSPFWAPTSKSRLISPTRHLSQAAMLVQLRKPASI